MVKALYIKAKKEEKLGVDLILEKILLTGVIQLTKLLAIKMDVRTSVVKKRACCIALSLALLAFNLYQSHADHSVSPMSLHSTSDVPSGNVVLRRQVGPSGDVYIR